VHSRPVVHRAAPARNNNHGNNRGGNHGNDHHRD
jgi:hypothetical protein